MTGARAKRSLSQNFLIDPNLRRKIVGELGMRPDDQVLEVGPGHGELSDLIVGEVRRLVAVEKDDRLAAELRQRYADRTSVVVVHGDALEVDLQDHLDPDQPPLVVSNVPYGITSPLLFRLLDLDPFPRRLVLLVQSEVADRVTAQPGNRVYGALSVGVQARARPRVAFRVGRLAFRPVPAVDSALVVIEPLEDVPSPRELRDLRVLTRTVFSRRRKQIGGILRSSAAYGALGSRLPGLLDRLGIPARARPEAIAPKQFLELAAGLRAASDGDRDGAAESS